MAIQETFLIEGKKGDTSPQGSIYGEKGFTLEDTANNKVWESLGGTDWVLISENGISYITVNDITWAELTELENKKSSIKFNITTANPETGITYGYVVLLSSNKFNWVDTEGLTHVVEISNNVDLFVTRVAIDGGITEQRSILDNAVFDGTEKLVMYPVGYKPGKVYSFIPDSGLGDLVYDRISIANRLNDSNLFNERIIADPLIDYLTTPGELLIETECSNKLRPSSDFTDPLWILNELNVTPNDSLGLDGLVSATKLTPTIASSRHTIANSSEVIIDNRYIVYVKANGYDWILLSSHTTSAVESRGTYFNIANGTIGTVEDGSTVEPVQNPTIDNLGNGWYKCAIDQGAIPSTIFTIFVANADEGFNFIADGTSSILIWEADRSELVSSPLVTDNASSTLRNKATLSLDNMGTNGLIGTTFEMEISGSIQDSNGENVDLNFDNSSNDLIGIYVSARTIYIKGIEAGVNKFDYETSYIIRDVFDFKFIYTGTNLLIYESNVLVSTQPLNIGQITNFINDSTNNILRLTKLIIK